MGKSSVSSPPPVYKEDPDAILESQIGDQLAAQQAMMQQMMFLTTQMAQPSATPTMVESPIPGGGESVITGDPIEWTAQIREFQNEAGIIAEEMTKRGIAGGTLLTSPLVDDEDGPELITPLLGGV